MANIVNLERNLEVKLFLIQNDMLDYNSERSNYENWIPFTLCLNLPSRNSIIEEDANATMTVFEVENLLCGIENVLLYLEKKEKYVYSFSNSESFFELRLEIIPEDNVIEIELWINLGNQTKGKVYGFDEGVRFITGKKELNNFLKDLKDNYLAIMLSLNS